MDKSLEAIQSDLVAVKAVIEKCDQLKEKATAEQQEQLSARRTKLEARRDRLAVALDVVTGRAYAIWDINDELTVVKPNSEGTARLIKTAEEYGARATEVHRAPKQLL